MDPEIIKQLNKPPVEMRMDIDSKQCTVVISRNDLKPLAATDVLKALTQATYKLYREIKVRKELGMPNFELVDPDGVYTESIPFENETKWSEYDSRSN